MMKNTFLKVAGPATLATLLPMFSHAEGVAGDLHSLQGVLNQLYNQMLPLCQGMISVSRAIAGFAALFFIGSRIWKHQAAAEPIDIYPLLRPFVLGFCIVIFPSVIALINGVMQPIVTATEGMVTNSNAAIARLTAEEPAGNNEDNMPGSDTGEPDKWYQYSHPGEQTAGDKGATVLDAYSGWGIKNWARRFIAEVLNVLFQAAALCIDTIRTFKLIVLAIIGPLCFGLSIFDGFQHTLKQWIARYVNVFMWLPIANIFGAIIAKIQENMIIAANSGDLGGNAFGNTNTAYLIFLLIGIIGYFTVPSIANYVMNVGGHALFSKTSALSSMAVSYMSGAVSQNLFKGHQPIAAPKSNAGGEAHFQNKLSGNNDDTPNLKTK